MAVGTFKERYLAGEIPFEEIDRYISRWNNSCLLYTSDNDAIVAYGTRFLRGFCLGLPFMCMDFLAVGVFQAIGMGGAALSFAILRKIVLEIPALYLLNWLFPLYGLAYAPVSYTHLSGAGL